MVTFRGSRSGECIRKIVLAEQTPEVTKPEKGKLDFLAAGHYLQRLVEDVICEERIKLLGVEGEGVHTFDDEFEIVGHVDGVIQLEPDDPLALLEVKCVRHHNFLKLKASMDWREQYGQYVPQAQCYLHFDELKKMERTHKKRSAQVEGPFFATYFWFMDRDTCDHMSGIPGIERPNHEYRADMLLYPDLAEFNDIVARHKEAYTHIKNGTTPEYCDKQGYCFFCRRGFPKKDPRGGE